MILQGFIFLLCAAAFIFIWTVSDSQIDRSVKIGLSVVIALILAVDFVSFIGVSSSKVFSLQSSSHGYRYPMTLRTLLLLTTLVLGLVSIVIASTTIVPDTQQKTILAGLLGSCSILAGIFYLYYQTTLLPVDFSAVQDYVEKKGLDSFFPETLSQDKFDRALEVVNLPNEIKDSLAESFAQGRPAFIKAMKELPFEQSVQFKSAYLNPPTEYASVVRDTLADKVSKFRKQFEPRGPKIYTSSDLAPETPGVARALSLQQDQRNLKDAILSELVSLNSTINNVSQTLERGPSNSLSQVLDFSNNRKAYLEKQLETLQNV